jgi:hypothetical protein
VRSEHDLHPERARELRYALAKRTLADDAEIAAVEVLDWVREDS